MAGVSGPNFLYPHFPTPYGPLLVRTLPFACVGFTFSKIQTSSETHVSTLGWVWVVIW